MKMHNEQNWEGFDAKDWDNLDPTERVDSWLIWRNYGLYRVLTTHDLGKMQPICYKKL